MSPSVMPKAPAWACPKPTGAQTWEEVSRLVDEPGARQDTRPLPPDDVDAGRFLRGEAAALQRALRASAAADRLGGGVELDHESWLALIATLHARGQRDAADELCGLYSFHGRVVTSLERGVDPRLGAAVASRVRALLIDEVGRRTTRACRTLPRVREIVVC